MSDCFDHAADAYDDWCFGQTSDEGRGDFRNFRTRAPTTVTCKICGKSPLKWSCAKNGKYFLTENGKPHSCIAYLSKKYKDWKPT
jgi:hypothetical protein